MKKEYRIKVSVVEVGINDKGQDCSLKQLKAFPIDTVEDLPTAMTRAAEAVGSTGNREVIKYVDENGIPQEVLP